MDYKELLGLIEVVDKSTLTKFSYKEGNLELEFEKKCSNENNKVNKDEEIKIETESLQEDSNSEEKFEYIKSSLIGTFYSSPSPDTDKFISVGDKISKNQVIGIIEVMKMMNEVKSDFDGIVEDILIDNNETVEYGQSLVKIKLA